MQELVEQFQNAREPMLSLAKKEAARIANGGDDIEQPSAKKRKVGHVEQEDEPEAAESGSQRMRTRSRGVRVEMPTQVEEAQIIEDSQDDDEDFVPGKSRSSSPPARLILAQRMDFTLVLWIAV